MTHNLPALLFILAVFTLSTMVIISFIQGLKDDRDYRKWVRENEQS